MNPIENIFRFHRAHRVISHLVFWIAVLLLSIADNNYQYKEPWSTWSTIYYYCLTLVTQILTAYFLAYFILPWFWRSKKYFLVFLVFLAGMYLLCVLARIINVKIHEPLAGVKPKNYETYWEIATNVVKLFYVYFFRNLSMAVVFLLLKLLVDQYTIQQRTLSLEKQKAETELQLLKTQLNPHFLFNTLNNIYSLAVMQSYATPTAIARLSDMLDHILYRCNSLLVPLSREIELLQNYIELEKLRYDERLQVDFQIHRERDIQVAPLILLSIVENAFKHGAGNDMGFPHITIDLQVTKDLFIFKVVNPLSPETAKTRDGLPGKIGLNNLKRQLELIYGKDYRLDIQQENTHFTVNLQVYLNSNKALT